MELVQMFDQKFMNKINIVIPMAGIGKRFSDCGYTLPKPLLSLGKYSMIECVIKNLFV